MAKGNGLEIVYPNAAALDIGATEIMAALPPDRAGETVRAFGTLTPDLRELVAWLKANGITHVSMESTGVYWIPIYEMLEEVGFVVIVVNPRRSSRCQAGRVMCRTASGSNGCTAMGCCRPPFVRMQRYWCCGPTCANGTI